MSAVFEILIGVLYVVGALFNSLYTLRHGEEFYTSFVEGAWLRPARRLTESIVVPNATLFTVVLIMFQLVVGVSILTRGWATVPALVAGGIFAAAVAAFSSPWGTAGNVSLAAVQLLLAAR